MDKLEELSVRIEANKEVLSTLPQNNEKNINIYIQKVNELQEEFGEYKKQILKEMEKRYERITNINKNPEISSIDEQIKKTDKVLYLLNEIETSYEKMGIDKEIQNLRYYYRKNLEIVNETILYCIKKFEEVGIYLQLEDFCYSKYVKEYLAIFFQEMEDGDIYSEKIKSKFEEIYWKCPDIITHIELNIRYLYLKNEKEIDKYYQRKKAELLKNLGAQEIIDRYMDLKKQFIEKSNEDKYTIINDFMEGKKNTKDYSKSAIEKIYAQYIPLEILETADENKLNEINVNMGKLLNSIYEYKHYMKFKFIIDDVKTIYQEKEKYKNIYDQAKKEIVIKENMIMKLNTKIDGKGLFKKPDEKYITEQNNLILEVKKLYRELDKNKIYHKIHEEIKDSSTISDIFYFASSFYNYLFYCIKDKFEEIREEEIQEMIEELRKFVKWPYYTLTNNIEILEEKNVLIIIKDRYQLLGINIEKEKLEIDNLGQLESEINKIEINHNIKKNKIDVEEIGYICEFKKIKS